MIINYFCIAVPHRLQVLPSNYTLLHLAMPYLYARLSLLSSCSFLRFFVYNSALIMPGARRVQVPQPAFFLQHPGEPPIPFSTWISAFDAYLRLVELERGEALSASMKNSLLFSLLGQEGLCQFGNDPVVATMTEDDTMHAIFRAAVRHHFKWTTNVARACFDFHMRRQGPTESAAKLIASLRELAPDSNFPTDYSNRTLAEQLVCGCHSSKACERMLLIDPDLDAYLRILESDEVVQEDSKIIASGSSSTGAAVHFVQWKKGLKQPWGRTRTMPKN